MTEQEAAERLCTLLNEIEAAGHEVYYSVHSNIMHVGDDQEILAPPCEGEPWERVSK